MDNRGKDRFILYQTEFIIGLFVRETIPGGENLLTIVLCLRSENDVEKSTSRFLPTSYNVFSVLGLFMWKGSDIDNRLSVRDWRTII